MFGIIHGLFTILAIGVDGHNKKVETLENKARAIENGRLTYNGSRGNEYLVENDRWVSTKTNDDGEKVITDIKTGKTYYNLSAKKKRDECQKCLAEGKTVRCKMENELRQTYYGRFRRPFHLVDIDSGIPVDEVCINGVKFYIRLSDGTVLRPIDNYNIKNKVGNWNVKELVAIVNNRQNKLRGDVDNHDFIWIKNEFFFYYQYVYVDSNKELHVFRQAPTIDQWNFVKEDGGYEKKGEDW